MLTLVLSARFFGAASPVAPAWISIARHFWRWQYTATAAWQGSLH